MEETESQIAKISLGNSKSANTYVYVMAEKAPVGEAELYVVAELPLFNPAAEESCERICLAIGSTLKRAYRKPNGDNTFENAISQINEELGKLASMGQTNWVYKLNCILGAKEGHNFHIATCGKVSSYLIRNGQFTDISCSQKESHPLKTFESFASGKIRLGDILLLSTTQLFNYISMDRILNILENSNFLNATQTVIQLLKDVADPQTSFGVLFNLQVTPGQTQEESIDLENYVVEDYGSSWLTKSKNFVKSVFAMDKAGRKPQTALPKVSLEDRIRNFSNQGKSFLGHGKNFWQHTVRSAKSLKQNLNKEQIKNLSPIKKFFIASLLILFIAVISSIYTAVNVSKTTKIKNQTAQKLAQVQGLIETSQSALLYKDYETAGKKLIEAKNLMPKESDITPANKEQFAKLSEQIKSQEQQMEKQSVVQVESLGSLGQGSSLIDLPDYIGMQSGNAIISFNIKSGKIEDNQLRASGLNIIKAKYLNNSISAIYGENGLYIWDFSQSKTSSAFSQSLAAKDDFGGMAFYPTNSRVYVADRKNSQIVSFLSSNSGFSRPVVAISEPTIQGALDIAIDSSIYILTKTGITKYQAGKLAEFNFPNMPTPFSGNGKIFTDKDSAYVYILDIGNNRIIATDKTGNLIYTLVSEKFTKLSDFAVKEKAKSIYLLNDGNLLKATLP